jgi:hypothetical protein
MERWTSPEPITLWKGISVQHKSAAEARTATWTFRGREGLSRFGNVFDPGVKDFISPTHPVLTKKGTIKVHQLRVETKPVNYWKAQCAFRGFAINGNVLDLHARLRAGPIAEMAKNIRELAEKSETQFWIQDKKAREDEKAQLEAIYVKQGADTDKFLQDEFRTRNAESEKAKVVVVFADDHFGMHVSVKNLGLSCFSGDHFMLIPHLVVSLQGL